MGEGRKGGKGVGVGVGRGGDREEFGILGGGRVRRGRMGPTIEVGDPEAGDEHDGNERVGENGVSCKLR